MSKNAGTSDVKAANEPTMWTKLPPQRLARSRFAGVDILAAEVSRSRAGHPRHALFLGAGASVSSGIPAGNTLIDQWRHFFFQDRCRQYHAKGSNEYRKAYQAWLGTTAFSQYENDARAWEQLHGRHPSEYGFLFNFISNRPFGRQEVIERLVEEKEPGPGYIYLASLVKANRFRTILTTNFDDLIHDAFFRYADLKPAVCAFDSQITSIHPNTARPTIVKLHGDFMYNNMRNVGPEVQRLSENMREKLYQTCKGNGLIVIGYGGADESIMMPIAAMLHDGTYLEDGLHWCLHCQNDADFVMVPGEVWRLYESHPDRVQLYCTDGFDDAIQKMYCECRCSPPIDLVRPRERSLFQRLNKALLASDWRYRVSEHFNGLLFNFLNGDHEPRPWYAHTLDVAEYHFSTAKACQKTERYDLAANELAKAIGECDIILHAFGGHWAPKRQGEPAFVATPEKGLPDVAAAVWAHRRRSGALSQTVDLDFVRLGIKCRGTKDVNDRPTLRKTIGTRAADCLKSALKGLELATNSAESSSHVRALTYNALVAYGYERLVRSTPLPSEALNEVERLRGELRIHDTDSRDLLELMDESHGFWLVEGDLERKWATASPTKKNASGNGELMRRRGGDKEKRSV